MDERDLPASIDKTVSKIEKLMNQLEEVVSIQEAKDYRDFAEAAEGLMRSRGFSLEQQNRAANLKLRAERRIGELLKQHIPHQGGRPEKEQSQSETVLRLKDLRINKSQSSRWQSLADIPKDVFDQAVSKIVEGKDKELTRASFQRTAARLLESQIESTEEEVQDGSEVIQIPPPELTLSIDKNQFWKIGRHTLYTGEPSSPAFQSKLSGIGFKEKTIALAVAEFSGEQSSWNLDFLIDHASIVAVLVPPESMAVFLREAMISSFYRTTIPLLVKETSIPVLVNTWVPVLLFAKDENAAVPKLPKPMRSNNPSCRITGRVMHELVEMLSEEGDLVIDASMETHNGIRVAERLGRSCIGATGDLQRASKILAEHQNAGECQLLTD